MSEVVLPLPKTEGGAVYMTVINQAYYDDQAEDELRLAAHAASAAQRKIHLNRAAELATLAERLTAPGINAETDQRRLRG
jgi:hypothetical protein